MAAPGRGRTSRRAAEANTENRLLDLLMPRQSEPSDSYERSLEKLRARLRDSFSAEKPLKPKRSFARTCGAIHAIHARSSACCTA